MHKSVDYHTSPQYGWNTASTGHADHVTGTQRMPGVITDVPHYLNVHAVLQNKVIYAEESEGHHQQGNHHKHQEPEAQKKVHFTEHEKVTEVVKNGKGEVYVVNDINLEADGFIKQEHKKFEMYKWGTFKG